MSTRTYSGSCQCGRIRFEAEIDLSAHHSRASRSGDQGTALIPARAFRLLSGEADLSDTQFGPMLGHNQFCRHCRVRPFGKGHLAAFGGGYYLINLSTLDLDAPEPALSTMHDAGASSLG
jgi:hypothetical protein